MHKQIVYIYYNCLIHSNKYFCANMLIGQRVKQAIEESDFTTEEVASYIGISHTNLYRIYKKDSFEIKYLIKIAEKLNLPLGYFLNDETIGAITQNATGKQVQQANQVGQNHQSINVGMSAADCMQKLEALQEKYALLEKVVDEKERTIKILMKE